MGWRRTSVFVFFKDFYKELKDLTSNGIQICEITKKRAFICDAPAIAFCKSVLNHNEKSGCHECNQVGFRLSKTPVYSVVSGQLRTYETFANRTDPKHHHQLEKLDLEKAAINMVTQFPLDPMHLVGLGNRISILCAVLGNRHSEKLHFV